MRTVDGLRVAFVEHDSYFAGFATPGMYSTARAAGADVVMLLAPGKVAADIGDDEVRQMLELVDGRKALGVG